MPSWGNPGGALVVDGRLEASFERVARGIRQLAGQLPAAQCALLARYLDAVRAHPFIGDGTDREATDRASEHIAEHVKPSRRRAREVADDLLRMCAGGQIALADGETEDTGHRLGARLHAWLSEMDTLDRFQGRELLSNGIGGLSPSGAVPAAGWRRAAWVAGVRALSGDAPVVPVPVRPPFVTDSLLRRLTMEAQLQSFQAVRMALRYVAPPGPAARMFGVDADLSRLVTEVVGHAIRPGNGYGPENATYLYYEDVRDGVQPHVDPFGITNALLMLEHEAPGDGSPGSSLVVYDPGGRPTRVPFAPGELVVLSDGAVVHSREPIGPGERVILLSLVFADGDRTRETGTVDVART